MSITQFAVRGNAPYIIQEAQCGRSKCMVRITQYAIRVERTVNNTGNPMWEDHVHKVHHTMCRTGDTYPRQYRISSVAGIDS